MKEDKQLETITISFEEYKELLIIKGRYEELKSQQSIPWTHKPNIITYRDTKDIDKDLNPPYKVTC